MLPTIPLTDPVYFFGLLLLLIWIAPWLASQLRLPAIVVLILLGTLLGTNGIGLLARDQPLILLERVGLLYIMLLAGARTGLTQIRRLGIRAGCFGLLTFGVPFSIGFLSGVQITHNPSMSFLLGILYSPHTLMAYPIVITLGISHLEAMSVAVGGSVITTVLTLSSYAILQATQSGGINVWFWIRLFVLLPIAIAGCFWLIPQIGKKIATAHWEKSGQALIFALVAVFTAASLTHLLGVDAIVGAFIAGLALNRLISPDSSAMQQIELLGNGLFIPIFAISIGVLSNPRVLFSHPENLGVAAIVVAGAVGAKFLAAWGTGKLFHYHFASIMTIFGLTMSRSALVLVIALFGKTSGLLSEGFFNAIVVYILVTCLIGPFITSIWGKAIARG